MAASSRADLYASRYPVLVLRNVVLLPGHAATIAVASPEGQRAVDFARRQEAALAVVVYADGRAPNMLTPQVGTLARIAEVVPQPDQRWQVRVEGLRRVRVLSLDVTSPAPQARIELLFPPVTPQAHTMAQRVRTLAGELHRAVGIPDAETLRVLEATEDPDRLADLLAGQLVRDVSYRQRLLELVEPNERLEHLAALIERELARVAAPSAPAVPAASTRLSAEPVIVADETSEAREEAERLRQRLATCGAPPAVVERVEQEIERLSRMSPASAEATVTRTYIETVLSVPWLTETPETVDLARARAILERDHYGLERVKERLLEELAVRALTNGRASRSTVLCFVGPPGVGKTSLARSIAEALGRRFVTVSLGGVRDEAEIRGHRRTYLGAYPGRIVEALRRAGTRNPVILLDELDKLATDYRGDPAAALLEVLDPEQNKQFVDHYLDVPVDLSGVLFIATANSLAPLPRPLRDRLEAIVLEGYSEEEKREIGKRYLLPRQLAAHGLPETAVELTDSAWQELITGYTREAGVRELERQLAALCRKMAREVVERGGTVGTLSRRRVTPATLRRLLGPPPYREMTATSEPQVGLALGLGATPVGGMLVPVEVLVMPGRGELLVTGQAGEVLQESARAALSWVRAHAARLGISADFVERMDIHVHLPEGALPKEGPSAGLALVVALVSALSARPVRSDLALTGEITLRGRVLPVGDLRQKALAVQRAGLRELVAPAANQVEASRLPASLARRLTVHWVETIEQALELALLPHRNDA
ncbi:endopeptidase La [Thermomicrobium roseum]|uniref:Lon protease n=1 Tax=Thermomicrobium roseum (strain ATCC 27502 / DSM 5159 / P-2) TaxID=309801 RepID=B9L069_THERP|nr:endopeptidase La [Thermomicrobium roseum]ACM04915.1 ATP-dependent protease La [Thermomicrobium roseum DSM 5159]